MHRASQKDCWHRLLLGQKRRTRRRPGRTASLMTALDHRWGRRAIGSRLHAVRPRCGQGLLVLHERQTRSASFSTRSIEKLSLAAHRSSTRQTSQAIRKTRRFDNGSEFAEHRSSNPRRPNLTCRCHSPWQKGGVKTPSGAYDARCPAKTDLKLMHSRAARSAPRHPHANAWTSRRPAGILQTKSIVALQT